MAYEIPLELEYQERIIFNLTFKQLLYAIIFFPFLIFILLKLQIEITLKIALSLIPISLASLFMFTNIPKKALNFCKWYLNREISKDNNKIKLFFNLDKIDNDTIYFKDRKIAIIKIDPINFYIKNSLEKEFIILNFEKFLNSLDFPIQIIISTNSIKLDSYLDKLKEKIDKLNNNTYTRLFDSFKNFLYKIITKKDLLNRSFYLIIKEKREIGLEIQVNICEELLKNLNLKFNRINNNELLIFIRISLNNSDNNVISPDNEYSYSDIAPDKIINNPNEVQINNKFIKVIAVKGYPRIVEEGFLDKIITLNGDFDISLHIEPFPIETTMIFLNKELQKQRADLYAMERKEIINPSLEIKFKDTRNVLEQLQKGYEKLFNVSLYIACKGKDLNDLNLISRKIKSELNSLMMIPYIPTYEMDKALKSSLPLGLNELNIKRNITTKALSAFFPFTSQFLQVDESGVMLGLNKNNIPLIKDVFKLYNANGVVLASSGAGKSYFTKLMISRLLLNGTKVIVIDPQSEYIDLVKRFNGQIINISRDSETIINPLDLIGHDFDDKKLTLLDLFPIMLGQISEIQKAVLDRALTIVYESKGISNYKETWKREPPILNDLLKQLKSMSKTASKVEMETYRSIINRLEMYVTGVFNFLNKQTNIDFNNRFVCFNIGDMPSQVKPVIMFLILDYVYMKMKKDLERKVLIVDEAWSLLERTEDESYIFRIVKACRKFNLGLLLITQDVDDLLKNSAGKALLNNSEYTLLLRQKPSIINLVEKTFQLSQKEREILLSSSSGNGLIIIGNEHSEIKIVASDEEHKIITTNADERLQKEIEKSNEVITKFEKLSIDLSKGFYKKSELNNDEVEELRRNGYSISKHIGLFGGRAEEYLLKPRYNESAEHFAVIKLIEKHIRKYTDKIWLFETKEPDIVFEIDNKKYAIEVETGDKHRNARNKLLKKVDYLNKEYGNNWFFVVTDWIHKENYIKLGKTAVRKEIPQLVNELFFPVSNFGI